SLSLREELLEGFRGLRISTRTPKGHRLIDLVLPLRLQGRHLPDRQYGRREQSRAIHRDRIDHGLALFFRPISAAVTDEVAVQTLGLKLENRAALAAPCPFDGASRGFKNQIRVVAGDIFAGQGLPRG